MKRNLRPSGILVLFALAIITQNGIAQPHQLRFQHLTVEEGLSASVVHAITQDKDGFVWLGTTDGLNRYDGRNVEVFRSKPGDSSSLPDNSVISLYTDSRGIVWIGCANGLARYDKHANSFRSFVNNPKNNNSLPSGIIYAINEDSRGLLWIAGGQGLCSFDIKKNHFHRFLKDDHSSNSISTTRQIRDIKFAPDGTMWIATGNGLNRLDLTTMRWRAFYHDPGDSTTLSSNSLGRIDIDRDGNLWTAFIFGHKLYLDRFNTKTYRCRRFIRPIEIQSPSPPDNPVFQPVFADKSGRVWIGSTQSGLSLFIPNKNIFYQYQLDPFDPSSIQSNHIRGIYQDHSGIFWLGTLSGAERFNPDESKFILYRSQTIGPFSPAQKSVRAFGEDMSHRLWIGTSQGLFILDRNSDKFTQYQCDENNTSTLDADVITSICRDSQGRMWIGTKNGLKLFDPVHKTFRSFYAENNNRSLAGNNILSIVCAKNGDLLIGSGINIGGSFGFSIYNTRTNHFVNFHNDTLLNLRFTVVFEDNRGRIWLGTGGTGLIRYDRKSGELKNFIKTANDNSSLPALYVGSITQDHKGVIWVGTNAGLSRFEENTQGFTNFTDKNGLPNVRIKQLLVDDKDRIWMASNRGISMFNESRTEFTNYDPSDGLQGWEFSEPSAFKTYDGYFCYGGSNGFNMFHPDSIKKNLFVPPVMLRRITIFDQPLNLDSSYTNLKSLCLSYKQNFFSFEFAALNYDHPEKNQYACQLIPFDKKMVELGTNHLISYTNVPPGNYTLKVKASNNDGVWNDAGYELKLMIIPPFWATLWFRIIVMTLLAGAVFLFVKRRESRIKKEQARQIAINKEIAEIRMTALQTQMNPHFIFNSLNSIDHFILQNDKAQASKYLSKFSKLIRKTLENSRENAVSIGNEMESLELYIQLEQLRFNHKFDYHISVDETIDTENTGIPPLLIQPYIENAILHGLVNKNGKGDLWFSIEKINGSLICKIEDNGIGRARSEEIEQKKVEKHKSLGIKVTNERISTLSALLDYKTNVIIEDLFDTRQAEGRSQPAGTRVTITIPVKEEE